MALYGCNILFVDLNYIEYYRAVIIKLIGNWYLWIKSRFSKKIDLETIFGSDPTICL